MRIRTLGRSGLRVSEICLGAMTFGMPEWGCDERESLALIDRYLAAGGNFIDTADAYSGTISEEICGKAMAGRRTQIVLATKATMPVGFGPERPRLLPEASPRVVRREPPASQDRLHRPLPASTPRTCGRRSRRCSRRSTTSSAPGKCSTPARRTRAYRLMKALALADQHGWSRFVSLQPQYNLIIRSIEREHFPLATEEGIGIITWSPLPPGC
jgi:aryl-alcohol dehydrogenase-like predicted oxidoreductase